MKDETNIASDPPAPSKYRADIDGLRAVAVLSVVGYHASPHRFEGGFVGVDVFFVISGFLISSIIFENLDKGTFRFGDFYSRRIKRVFPALFVVLTSCFAFGWFALLAEEYKQLGKHIFAGTGFVSNFGFWQEAGYFDNAAETKPLLHLWSLGIEEQFYIVWPLLLWFSWKKRLDRRIVCLVVIASSFAINARLVQTDAVAAFYSPLSRVWELVCGGLLAYFTLDGGRARDSGAPPQDGAPPRNARSLIGILLLAAGAVFVKKDMRFPGWWALLPTLGTFLIISAGPAAWLNRAVLSNRVLVWFGVISYPLYLWHWPLLSFARIIESRTPSQAIRTAAVLLSIGLAWLTYVLIERPMRSSEYGKVKITVLIALMTAVGSAGYNAFTLDGLPFRAAAKEFLNNDVELIRAPERDGACTAYISNPNPRFRYCRFNDAGRGKTIAVIGDSHAFAAFPGIAEMAAARDISVVTLANTGCPPLIGTTIGADERHRLACAKKIEQLLETVKNKSDIFEVFIFTRGEYYLSGEEFSEAERGPNRFPVIRSAASLHDGGAPADIFKNSLQATVDSLRLSGKDVYYVLENPELIVDPAACISRPLRVKTRHCELEVGVVLKRQARYRKIISGLKNVKILDSVPIFCPEGTCRVFENGVLMYADTDHLSVTGSRFQARLLLPELLGRFRARSG